MSGLDAYLMVQKCAALARLILLQADRQDTEAAADDVVEGFATLGLGARAEKVAELVHSLCYKGIGPIDLAEVIFHSVAKVTEGRFK